MRRKNSFSFSTTFSPRPSFISGIGSAFNVFGNYYNFDRSNFEDGADEKAIASDWYAIGNDLYDAIEAEKREG